MRAPGRRADNTNLGPVARELLGEPTKESHAELRFGTRGRMPVSLAEGTWHDFESGTGGGVLALLQQRVGLDKDRALAWLRERGLLMAAEPPSGGGQRVVRRLRLPFRGRSSPVPGRTV
jgi:hypothetical protein